MSFISIKEGIGMLGPKEEILTIEEAIQFSKLGKTTLYRLARAGKVPARKIGREWQFVKSQLIEWIKGKGPRNNTSG